jgi:hypothetical protein
MIHNIMNYIFVHFNKVGLIRGKMIVLFEKLPLTLRTNKHRTSSSVAFSKSFCPYKKPHPKCINLFNRKQHGK